MVAVILILLAALGIITLLVSPMLAGVRDMVEAAKVVGVFTVLGVIGAVSVIFVWACVVWFVEHAINLV